jgi:hypothetical protein
MPRVIKAAMTINRDDSARDIGFANVAAPEFVQLSNFLSAIPFVFDLQVRSKQYGSRKPLYSESNCFRRGREPLVIQRTR